MNIPAGYQIHFITWENDGDAYATKILSGLNEADAKFFYDLASNFKSRNSDIKGYGNGEVDDNVLKDIFKNTLEKHPLLSTGFKDEINECIDDEENGWLYLFLCDNILDQPHEEIYWTDYNNFCRVVERIQVYYLKEPAVDMTEQFK